MWERLNDTRPTPGFGGPGLPRRILPQVSSASFFDRHMVESQHPLHGNIVGFQRATLIKDLVIFGSSNLIAAADFYSEAFYD
jgi:hypothetical protein